MKKPIKKQKEIEKRHKCTVCGKVRFEKFMTKINPYYGRETQTRYRNTMWFCVDNTDCLHNNNKAKGY